MRLVPACARGPAFLPIVNAATIGRVYDWPCVPDGGGGGVGGGGEEGQL